MIQKVTGGLGLPPRIAASKNDDDNRENLRFNGSRERGFAFGKTRHADVQDKVDVRQVNKTPVDSSPVDSSADKVDTYKAPSSPMSSVNPPSSSADADTNAVLVTKGENLNINVTITEGNSKGNHGVVQFEEGGSYTFSRTDHPGAKYAVTGLEGGNGITNPNNLKGVIHLKEPVDLQPNDDGGQAEEVRHGGHVGNENGKAFGKFGAAIFLNERTIDRGNKALHATAENSAEHVDKVAEFLKKKDEIADKAGDKPEKTKRADDITIEDLERFNLLSTPDVGILNIHDDRFDKSKFTDKEVLSLKVASKLEAQDSLNPIHEDKEQGRGLKLGHFKNGTTSYGAGLKLGHQLNGLSVDHSLKNPLFA